MSAVKREVGLGQSAVLWFLLFSSARLVSKGLQVQGSLARSKLDCSL